MEHRVYTPRLENWSANCIIDQAWSLYDVKLSLEDADEIWIQLKKRNSLDGFSVWLKSKLYEKGYFETKPPSEAYEEQQGVVLHVGFINHIVETPEMLARLKEPTKEELEKRAAIARSKLGKLFDVQFIFPIDKTAARVAPLMAE